MILIINNIYKNINNNKARYSTLEKDREIVCCFLDRQEINESPKKCRSR